MKFILIGFAGGIGVLLRFVVSGWGQKLAPGIFPLGTVIVNVTGCLLIGILGGVLTGTGLVRDEVGSPYWSGSSAASPLSRRSAGKLPR